jgi:TM2 domain-containing membrane protein YozV
VRNNVKQRWIAKVMASVIIGYVLWLFLGWLGIHRFYTGNVITGLIWMFSLGLFGIGWFVDIFLVPGLVTAANQRNQQKIIVMQSQQPGFVGDVAQHVGGRVVKHVATNAITDLLSDK